MKFNPLVADWLAALATAFKSESLVKLALTKPTPVADDLKSIDIRPILIKRELKLSFTYHHKTRDIVKNYPLNEASELLAKLMDKTFLSGKIFTLQNDVLLTRNGKGYDLAFHGATQKETLALTHDRAKQHIVKTGQDTDNKAYLHSLQLTDATGNVLKNAQDKFRQINKYVEILDSLVKNLPENKPLKIVDMGSGKGYLTFALYDHLTTTLGRKAEVTGVEFRPDMVKLCNSIAQQHGMTGLSFTQGTIDSYDCNNTDIVIALHACDTATDDAIAKGIKANASLIVVAPCCHKQIRRELTASKTLTTHPLNFMLRFGTYAERMAEMLTDSLRAQFLELSGYTTNVFEFIADAHTPKNVMIVATKSKPLSQPERTTLLTKITETKYAFGIKFHQLEKLLGL
ncbi:MAG: SAM-dependent methyltransferase [Pseudomonas fluorescens]|nr:MAG: SAM-dependent methyltransferase [Pseudomonas fluorescens]